jgi:hypothetical protein
MPRQAKMTESELHGTGLRGRKPYSSLLFKKETSGLY